MRIKIQEIKKNLCHIFLQFEIKFTFTRSKIGNSEFSSFGVGIFTDNLKFGGFAIT